MAVDPRVPEDVLQAAIKASGEIRRYYPHSDGDFRTDVSAMIAAAFEEFFGWDTKLKGITSHE